MATILVVDDEPDIRYLAQVNLELDGHRVLVAGSGAEALDVVDREVPDVMLLDVMMPDLDGWAVLERIKAHTDRDVSTIPVLLVTALGGDQDQVRGGIEGAIRYLTKPVTPDQLRDAITEALAGEPEPVQRRRVQQASLEALARMEKGGGSSEPAGPRPRLTRLERQPTAPPPEPLERPHLERLAELTSKQMELLQVLRSSRSVSSAATELDVSRSNIYASLRRIARKLDVGSVQDLLGQLRAGQILDEP
jgi:CheY-like chemotaxis protein/DNA-binding CsgD family transcriptional regulator